MILTFYKPLNGRLAVILSDAIVAISELKSVDAGCQGTIIHLKDGRECPVADDLETVAERLSKIGAFFIDVFGKICNYGEWRKIKIVHSFDNPLAWMLDLENGVKIFLSGGTYIQTVGDDEGIIEKIKEIEAGLWGQGA